MGALVASVVVLPAHHETEITAAEQEPSLVLLIGMDGRIVGALGDTAALTGFDAAELLSRRAGHGDWWPPETSAGIVFATRPPA